MTSKILQAAVDELTRTIDDLQQTLPGLQCSFIVSVPIPPNDAEATFSSTHDLEQAAQMMVKILEEGVRQGKDELPN
jgi:hypothetical protein